MLEKKEKFVLLYLCEICKKDKAYLISIEEMAEFISQKHMMSIKELNLIMITLQKENYIEYVVSNGKNEDFFVVNLLGKAKTFTRDEKNRKKTAIIALAKTLGLSILSFILGLLLKIIFKG